MKTQAGFSLVELVTVIGIAGLLCLFCAPELLQMRARHQFNAEILQMVQNLELAKYEAIMRNDQISVVFQANGYEIIIDDGTGGGIAGNYLRDGTEKLLFSQEMTEKIVLGHNFSGNRFRFSGTIGNKAGTVTLRHSCGAAADVVLNKVGRIRVEKLGT